MFALGANSGGQPPDRGVIEQQRLHNALQDVDEVVLPPDVRKLVRNNNAQLLNAEAGQNRDRQNDDRPEPSDHDR